MTKQKTTYSALARIALLSTAAILLFAAAIAAAATDAFASTTVASETTIVERQITIPDEELGHLTFDAITAGDPQAIEQDRLVLLLHGFPQSRESFAELLPELAARGYYAVAPNMRGYSPGARPTDRSQYTVEKSSVDAVAMAIVLGAEKFHLVGHDWGGAVVWGVSSAMPQVLKSSSVLSTPHPDAIKTTAKYWWSPQSLMLSYLKLVRIPDLERAMFIAGPEGFALGLSVMGLPYSKARTYAKTIGNAAGMRAALSWYHANEVPASYLIGKSTVPTLYMWGDKDFAFSRDAANKTAEYVDAPYRFVPLENIGHWVPERATDRVVSEVLAHIEANS